MLLLFLIVAQSESGTRKVTKFNKKVSLQCNVTAQIEQVQDNKKH
jgi:hypothetical protein